MSPACRVCGSATVAAGSVEGAHVRRSFGLAQCPVCGYGFVVDPVEDLGAMYSMEYYEGRGADPMLDYSGELHRPQDSVRRFEWAGILDAVRAHVDVDRSCRWLDFGCGNGGLVRDLRDRVGCDAVGHDEGAIVDVARATGIPILDADELAAAGPFDVITAIEVFEHVEDPRAVLGTIAELLTPGGLLFYTTGNAAPHRDALAQWNYVIPEIHISFFEPRTTARLIEASGLDLVAPRLEGWNRIYAYKILKNLGVKTLDRRLPLVAPPGLAAVVDRRYQLARFPLARRPR